MKVTGSTQIDGPPDAVFEHLLDADVLRACIPGCESLVLQEDGSYAMVVKAGAGSVKGSFKGIVTLGDIDKPHGYSMSVEGKSTVGHIRGGASVSLAPDGERTEVSWDGEGKVSGIIASMGGRLLDVAAKSITKKFFANLAEHHDANAS